MNHINKLIKFLRWKSIKKIGYSKTPDFFSKDDHQKKSLNENQLKFTYQKQLISDPNYKQKKWSKSIDS